MYKSMVFDITVDGITTDEIAKWIILSPNSGMPKFLRIGNLLYGICVDEEKPDKNYPRHELKISAYDAWEDKRRSEGLSEQEIVKEKKQRQLVLTGEVDGKPSLWYQWNAVRIGQVIIMSIGSGCQVVGESLVYLQVFRKIAERIMTVYRDRAHDNLADQPNSSDFRSKNSLSYKKVVKRPLGRPHLPDDIWAYEQIHKYKRDPKEVEKEWKEREGVKARGLINPKRHFVRIKSPDWLSNNDYIDII